MRKPELLVVSPLPPARSGIATYTQALLLGGLTDDWSVTVMLRDGEVVSADAPFPVIHASSHRWFLATANPHRILHCIGNSEFHTHQPGLIAKYGGVVLAHDIRMNGMHRMRSASSSLSLSSLVRERHGDHLANDIGELEGRRDHAGMHSHLDAANAYLFGAAVHGADAVAVHSAFAKRLADFELDETVGVTVVPFGHRSPPTTVAHPSDHRGSVTISSFGIVAPEKEAPLLIEALSRAVADGCDANLRFVGAVGSSFQLELQTRAVALGVGQRLSFSGHVDDDEYLRELESADLAIQLRAASNGEASAAIADCLSAGLPTIVTDIGGQSELPDGCVLKVPAGGDANEVSAAIRALVNDPAACDTLSQVGRQFAATHSFRNSADALSQLLHETPLGARVSRK